MKIKKIDELPYNYFEKQLDAYSCVFMVCKQDICDMIYLLSLTTDHKNTKAKPCLLGVLVKILRHHFSLLCVRAFSDERYFN